MTDTRRYRNYVELKGNLAADPEIRTVASGSKVCNITVVTNEFRKNPETEKWEVRSTEYHKVVVWNEEVIPVLENSARKGDLVSLVGKIKTRSWTATDNSTRAVTEIVVDRFGEFALVEKKKEYTDKGGNRRQPYSPGPATYQGPKVKVDLLDEDPPF